METDIASNFLLSSDQDLISDISFFCGKQRKEMKFLKFKYFDASC